LPLEFQNIEPVPSQLPVGDSKETDYRELTRKLSERENELKTQNDLLISCNGLKQKAAIIRNDFANSTIYHNKDSLNILKSNFE